MLNSKTIRNIRIYGSYRYTYFEIADRTGALFSEIRHVLQSTPQELKEYIEQEEKEMPNKLPEETKAQIAQALENGKLCKEVCVDFGVSRNTVTRIKKSLKEVTKEKPETAATESGTPQESGEENNFPTDIIPEKTENVKTPHLDFFNGAEEEAVINAVADKLDEYSKKISELSESIEVYKRRRDTLFGLLAKNGYKNVIALICKEENNG